MSFVWHVKNVHSSADKKVDCSVCGATFKNRDYMLKHYKRVHGGFLQKCQFCDKDFSCPVSLKGHIQTIHDEPRLKKVKCTQCEAAFTLTVQLNKHMRTKHPEDSVSCNLCEGEVVYRKSALKIHIAKAHGDTMPFQCPVCDTGYNLKPKFVTHLRKAHPEEKALLQDYITDLENHHQCSKCEAQFENRKQLLSHLAVIHKGLSLECPDCHKTFTTYQYLQSHKLKVHSQEKRQCDQCSKVFKNKHYLKEHVARVHINEKHECPKCGKTFRSKVRLAQHASQVHTQRRFKCNLCDKSCKEKRELERHVDINHLRPGHKPYTCIHCDKSYKAPSGLRMHVKREHGPGTKVQCDICLQICSDKSNLSAHKRRVHGDAKKTHRCELCEKTFRFESDLRKHVRMYHVIKEYPCDSCELIFKSETGLWGHKQTVHEKKRFPCEHCGHPFTQKGSLNGHLKRGCLKESWISKHLNAQFIYVVALNYF